LEFRPRLFHFLNAGIRHPVYSEIAAPPGFGCGVYGGKRNRLLGHRRRQTQGIAEDGDKIFQNPEKTPKTT
jgi:hypothetical protein